MRSLHRTLLILLLGIVCCLSPGCWDKVELEDVAWVQAMGFDKGPEGFMTTTFEIGVPRSLAGSTTSNSADGGPNHVTMSFVSRTAFEALDMASVTLGRRLSMQHIALFLFGEEYVMSDLRATIGALDRYREVRGSSYVAVCRGRAEDTLRVLSSPVEASPSRYIQTTMQEHYNTGLFETKHLLRLRNEIESSWISPTVPLISVGKGFKPEKADERELTQFPPTPKIGERLEKPEVPPAVQPPDKNITQLDAGELPRMGGGPVTFMGACVLRGGLLVGHLNGDETRAMLMVKGDFERGGFSIPDPQVPDRPQYALSVELRGSGRKVKVRRTGDRVDIHVTVELEATYLSMKTQTDYTDPRNIPLAQKAIADYVKTNLDSAIHRTQQMDADVFGFGRQLRASFLTWPEFEKFAWPSKYRDSKITTEVRVNLRRYGFDLGPLRVPPWQNLTE